MEALRLVFLLGQLVSLAGVLAMPRATPWWARLLICGFLLMVTALRIAWPKP